LGTWTEEETTCDHITYAAKKKNDASIAALGLDAIYLAFDAPPQKLMDILKAMRDMGFGGVNLTVPLKEVAFRGLDQLDESSTISGSVNTVEFLDNGEMRGHSTDGYGFVTAVNEAFSTTPAGKTVFVLGCGGAGRAVAVTCAAEGAARILLSDVDAARAETVAAEITESFRQVAAESAGSEPRNWVKAVAEADLVIQATPVGMQPEDTPLLGKDAFRPGQMLFDLIYMYPATGIMQEALAAGARAANGLGMLLHQGARSFKIWTGIDPDIAAMRQALENAVY